MSIIMVLVVIVGVLKGFKLFNSDNDNIYNYDTIFIIF